MFKKEIYRKIISNIGVIMALSPGYACGFVLNLIWKVEVHYVVVIPFLVSFLMAAILPDIKVTFFGSIISLIGGSLIAILIISGPVMIYNPELTEFAIIIALNSVARLLFIVNIAPTLIGVLLGHLFVKER